MEERKCGERLKIMGKEEKIKEDHGEGRKKMWGKIKEDHGERLNEIMGKEERKMWGKIK